MRGDHEVNEAKLEQSRPREVPRRPAARWWTTRTCAQKWAIGFVGPDAAIEDGRRGAAGRSRRRPGRLLGQRRQRGRLPRQAFQLVPRVRRQAGRPEENRRRRHPQRRRRRPLAQKRRRQTATPPRASRSATSSSSARNIPTRWAPTSSTTKGKQHPIIMGCYGIGVGRILIAAVESLHDDKGIIWPAAIAPYSVVITPIKYDGEVKAAADKLYEQLNAAGIDTLLDDRDARPGFEVRRRRSDRLPGPHHHRRPRVEGRQGRVEAPAGGGGGDGGSGSVGGGRAADLARKMTTPRCQGQPPHVQPRPVETAYDIAGTPGAPVHPRHVSSPAGGAVSTLVYGVRRARSTAFNAAFNGRRTACGSSRAGPPGRRSPRASPRRRAGW